MSAAATFELKTSNDFIKMKLNKTIKNDLLRSTDFIECLSVIDKTAIVYTIRINRIKYYIYFSTRFTELSAFYESKKPAEVYTDLRSRTKIDDDRYNFVLFLFLLKMRETETTEMMEPSQDRDDISLFHGKTSLFDSFKIYYPEDKVNIKDDVIFEVPPRVVVDGKLYTFENYLEKCKSSPTMSSCITMGGKTKKTKRNSKKKIIKRKSKKTILTYGGEKKNKRTIINKSKKIKKIKKQQHNRRYNKSMNNKKKNNKIQKIYHMQGGATTEQIAAAVVMRPLINDIGRFDILKQLNEIIHHERKNPRYYPQEEPSYTFNFSEFARRIIDEAYQIIHDHFLLQPNTNIINQVKIAKDKATASALVVASAPVVASAASAAESPVAKPTMLDVILQSNRSSSSSPSSSTSSPSSKLTVDELLSFGPGKFGNP